MNDEFYKYFLLLFIIFILQITVFSFQPVAGVKPDLLLVVVIINGLLRGINKGAKLGLGAGLLQDMFFSGIPGKFTFIKFMLGSIMGTFTGKFFERNFLFPFFFTFIATIFQEFILLFFSAGTFLGINYFSVIREIIFPSALYNGILGLILYPIFYKILKIGDKRLWIKN